MNQHQSLDPRSKSNLPSHLFLWFCFALITRVLASMTHSHWFHPDEWCQTFEPANLIAHGFGVHSQEIGLHLRNLTWPVILAAVLKLTHWLSPTSIDLRVFCVNLLCGLLDLLIFWGWVQLLKTDSIARHFSSQVKSWSLALLLLPWFSVYGSVSPRIEHLSEIALWTTLGLISNGFWIRAGIGSVAIAAFRYPSALFSLAIIGYVLREFVLSKQTSSLKRFSLGIVLGILLFGTADWVIYGRPWESLWMYLEYNLFSQSSTLIFGKQSVKEYLKFFAWNWQTYPVLLPLGFTLLLGGICGFLRGLFSVQLWSVCLLVYSIGHLLVPHKEERFMSPIQTLLLWAAFTGVGLILQKYLKNSFIRKGLRLGLKFSVLVNSFLFLHALRADLWKVHGTFRELGSHLRSTPHVCAILTASEESTIMTPFIDAEQVPFPALGILSRLQDRLGYSELKHSGIQWMEHAPHCPAGSDSRVLLHTHRSNSGWSDEGCQLLPTGLLRHLPESWREWVLQQGYKASSWYSCPVSVLNYFGKQQIHHNYSYGFGHIPELPSWKISPHELLELGLETSPPPAHGVIPGFDHLKHRNSSTKTKTRSRSQ